MPIRITPPAQRAGRGLLLLALLSLAAPLRATEPAVAGTMPEDYLPGLQGILDRALHQSPSMIAAELLVAVADAQRGMSGVAPLLPNIAVGPAYGKSVETVSGNSGASNGENGLVYSGTIRQNLFQWGRLKDQLEVQKTAELIAERNYAEAYRGFADTLRREYMALVVQGTDLRNARNQLDASRESLAVARDSLKRGAIAQSDIGPVELDADERQLGVDREDQAFAFARRTLARQVGMTDIPEASIPAGIPAPRYAPETANRLLAALMGDGARGTYQAQVASLNIRQADLNYRMARVQLLPQFFATAGISQQNNTYATAQSVQQTLVTNKSYYVNANWTLFDGLETHWAKVQALAYKRYWERQLEIATENALDQAENSRRGVDFAWRALQIADRLHAMADGYFHHVQSEFKLGNAPRDAFVAAGNSLYVSETALDSARADFLSSWGDFVSLAGADPAMNSLPIHYVRNLR